MTFSEMEAPSMRIVGGPWKDGPHGGVWSALRLDPWRVMVQTRAARAGRDRPGAPLSPSQAVHSGGVVRPRSGVIPHRRD